MTDRTQDRPTRQIHATGLGGLHFNGFRAFVRFLLANSCFGLRVSCKESNQCVQVVLNQDEPGLWKVSIEQQGRKSFALRLGPLVRLLVTSARVGTGTRVQFAATPVLRLNPCGCFIHLF